MPAWSFSIVWLKIKAVCKKRKKNDTPTNSGFLSRAPVQKQFPSRPLRGGLLQ